MFTSGILLLVQFGFIFAALPPVNKCKLSDSTCLKASAQPLLQAFVAGIPEAGTDILDPMKIDAINIDLSGLKLDIRNAVIKGLKNAAIDKISVDQSKKVAQLVFHADFTMRGKYKASGQLLILPISGDGDTVIKTKNCQITIDMPYEISKNSDGKDVINIKSHKFRFDVRDGASYQLTNLFNGNKPLSDALHAFMNGNWKTMTLEFGLPVFEEPIKNVVKSLKAYLSIVPIEDITIV